MQRIDLVILAALVVAVAGSALGVVTYEDDRLAAFRVAWATAEETIDVPLEGGGSTGAEMAGTVNVTSLNVTRAEWTVTVSGAPARVRPIPVRVEVIAPDNTTGELEGELAAGPVGSVDLIVPIELGEAPRVETATGATLDAARASLPASTNGTGAWTIRVSIGDPGPLGAAEQIATSIRATIFTYSATLTPETPEVSRG